jgi:DNA-directed RNA polymerase specialized sigma24 family protein
MKRRPRGHPGIEPADATPGTAGAGKAGAPLWEELYLTQRQGLIRFACRYTDPHQAEDIVQALS